MYNGTLCKCTNNDICYDTTDGCSEAVIECPHCGALMDNDNGAYAVETGLCQCCHKEIHQTRKEA